MKRSIEYPFSRIVRSSLSREYSYLILTFLLLALSPSIVWAQLSPKIWIGQGVSGSGTDFNAAANWSPTGVPSSADSCIIIVSANATITVSASTTVGAVYCAVSGSSQVLRLDVRDKTLTVAGSLIGEATSGDANTQVQFSVGAAVGSNGTLIVHGDALFGVTGTQYTYTRGVSGSNSKFIFLGNVTYGAYGATSGSNFPGSYIFDAVTQQTLTINNSNVAFPTLQFGKNNAPVVTLTGSSSGYLNGSISGVPADLVVDTNVTLDLGSSTLNRNIVGGTLSLARGAVLKLGGVIGGRLSSNFPLNFASLSIDSASTVDYNAPGGTNQSVIALRYGNLTLSRASGSATAVKTAPGVITVLRDMHIGSGVVFEGSSFFHIVQKNLAVDTLGSYQGTGGGKVVLQTGLAQHLLFGPGTFGSLELNDPLGAALSNNVTIGGTMTLTNGIFSIGANTLILNASPVASSGQLQSAVTGTVVYGSSSNGQAILPADYGNLTFNNTTKILPNGSTIGILGVFTPGTSTANTIAGSTIEFKSSGPQTIPGFRYFNLTSSGSGARTLDNSRTISIASMFTPGTNSYTVAGSTVEYNGTSSQTLSPAFATYYNLYSNNSLIVNGFPGLNVTNLLRIVRGIFSSAGTFDSVRVDSTASFLLPNAASVVNVSGDWNNNYGTFNPSGGKVRFNGTGGQSIMGRVSTTFDRLEIDLTPNTNITLLANIIVTQELALTSGRIQTGAKSVSLNLGAALSRTAGYVIGNLKKTFSSTMGDAPLTFEVGTANGYAPVSVTPTSGSGSGATLTVSEAEGIHPNALGPNVLGRSWILSPATGITSANVTLNYFPSDVYGNESGYLFGYNSGGSRWTLQTGSVNATLHQATLAGITTFGSGAWTLGESPSLLRLSVSPLTLNEDNSGITNFNFIVALSGRSPLPVSLSYSTADSTATTADNDYTAIAGTVTIAPYDSQATITVPVVGDTKREPNEVFTLALADPENASLVASPILGTIRNDDPVPLLTVGNVQSVEGNLNDTMKLAFSVSLSNPTSDTVSCWFNTFDGTARVADSDYVPVDSFLVVLPPNTVTEIVPVSINGDLKIEPSETLSVRLSAPRFAVLGTDTVAQRDSLALGIIVNDDSLPAINVSDAQAPEGSAGQLQQLHFTVSLASPSPSPISFHFSTIDSSARAADNDYLPIVDSTITIPPGTLGTTVTVFVVGDNTVESTESLLVRISSLSGAALGRGTGLGIIINDDGTNISIANVTRVEGDSGLSAFTFTVSLSTPVNDTVSVGYSTDSVEATATEGVDFVKANGILTIPRGQVTGQITVNVIGDLLDEADEEFNVSLFNSVHGTIVRGVAVGRIMNDEVKISTSSLAALEGQSGTTIMRYAINLSRISTHPVSVQFQTYDGTAQVSDNDYVGQAGTLNFTSGVQTRYIDVVVNGDTKDEDYETYSVRLSNVSNAVLAESLCVGTIQNDDAVLFVQDSSVVEPDTGAWTTRMYINVGLSRPQQRPVTVSYYTADGTANSNGDSAAVFPDTDYVSLRPDTLNFAIGQTVRTLSIRVRGDKWYEPNDYFFVNIRNPIGASIADSQGVATIVNNDSRIVVSNYFDSNHNGLLDPGESLIPLKMRYTIKSLDDSVRFVKFANDSGVVTFDTIPKKSYRVTCLLDPAYGYAVPPDSNGMIVDAAAPGDFQLAWVSVAAAAAQSFRTVRYEEWANAKIASSGKVAPVKRAPDKTEAKFYIIAPTNVTGFSLAFNMPFTGRIEKDSTAGLQFKDSLKAAASFSVKDTVLLRQLYYIQGFGAKKGFLSVQVKWSVNPKGQIVQPYKLPEQFALNVLRYPMPNWHNVGQELFPKDAGSGGPAFPSGLLMGVSKSAKGKGTVLHKKYADVMKSLIKAGQLHGIDNLQCLDKFTNGKAIGKALGSLPPSQQSNGFFAELLAFKLNLGASAVGRFPQGLGELIYYDSLNAGSPFNGKTLSEISALGDLMLSCDTMPINPAPTMRDLFNVIRRIDTTFSGPMDTVSFAKATRIAGVRSLRAVPFLFALPGFVGESGVRPPIVEQTPDQPDHYALYQNYPNPFNPVTTIQFDLPEQALVTLKVYNILGQEIATILDRELFGDGMQQVPFNAGSIASGVYFYRILAEGITQNDDGSSAANGNTFQQVRKMLLVK